MDRISRHRRQVGIALVIACLGWAGAVGWTQLVEMPQDRWGNHRSAPVRARMNACEGDFHHRFDCKQQVLLAGERSGFALAAERLALLLAPPVTAWIVWRATRPPPQRTGPEDGHPFRLRKDSRL